MNDEKWIEETVKGILADSQRHLETDEQVFEQILRIGLKAGKKETFDKAEKFTAGQIRLLVQSIPNEMKFIKAEKEKIV